MGYIWLTLLSISSFHFCPHLYSMLLVPLGSSHTLLPQHFVTSLPKFIYGHSYKREHYNTRGRKFKATVIPKFGVLATVASDRCFVEVNNFCITILVLVTDS